MKWSLRRRLSLGLAVSLVLLLALQWAVASLAIRHFTSQQLLARLDRDAESLLSGIHVDAGSALRIDTARVSAVYQRPFSGHYYVVRSGDQVIVSRSLWDARLAIPALATGARADFHAVGPHHRALLVRARAYRKQGREMTIAVAEDLSERDAGVHRFQLAYGAMSGFVLIVLLLVQRAIVSRGLRPFDAVRESMVRLARGEAARVEATGPAEIAPLIAELNRLLAAMSDRSRRSREALGNLAHGLKTRLAVLRQVAESPELAANAPLREALQESVQDMHRIVERALKRARLSGSALPAQRVPLRGELDALVATLKAIYADKSPAVDCDVEPGSRFDGDREDLLELLGNLLDNACKWCTSRVSVKATTTDGTCFLIEDDGPGCSPDALAVLTRRGFRADESRAGSGLGLAIVRDIVEGYGGTLQFGRSPALGGMRVEVRLPDPASYGAN